MPAPKIMDVHAKNRGFSCGPGDGEKLFDPAHPGVRVGSVCRKFGPIKFMFMLFFVHTNSREELPSLLSSLN